MTRRSFLRDGAMSVCGLFAASSLPAFADAPKWFPKRGRFERLSLACRHVAAGASKPFSILHISDTHLTSAGNDDSEWARKQSACRTKTFGGCQEEALRDSLAWAKEHVDYVIHTGDLIDFQSKANFELVKKYYGANAGFLIGSLGNHEYYRGQPGEDEKDSFKAKSLANIKEAFPFDVSVQSTVLNGVNFVALDNVYGTITEAQMGRLEAEFKKGLPVILFMHCPINTPNILRASKKFWSSANPKAVPDMRGFKPVKPDKNADHKKYAAYLKAQPLLKAILAGHIHVTVEDRFSPSAMEYVVGGNFLFHGQEITIA